jgi:antitoxin HicB
MTAYPAILTPDDNDTFMIAFPDVPGAISYGDTAEEALAHGRDALETMIGAMIGDREDIPAPSAAEGRPTVALSLLGELKVALYRAMRGRGWRKADLARALELNPRQIDRLLDLRHGSTVAQLDQALRACGQKAEVSTRALKAA